MGLTAEALEKRIIAYTNSVESDEKFNDDVDNLLKLKPLKNLLCIEVSAFDIAGDGEETH